MINVYLTETSSDVYRKYHPVLWLCDKQSIENEYRHIVEWHTEAFRDEMSLQIMKEIDRAERIGEYGVETPVGNSCITCLSTGCKLALVLWYAKNNYITVQVTTFAGAGNNVWKFISDHFDIDVVMPLDRLSYVPAFLSIDITVDGKVCSMSDFMLELDNKEEEKYIITKEKEEKAFQDFMDSYHKIFYRNLSEEALLKEFILSIDSDYDFEVDEYFVDNAYLDYLDYHVVNYFLKIPTDFEYRKLPLWIVGKKNSEYEFRKELTTKYPDFFDLILYNILDEQYAEYDSYMVLVIGAEERCPVAYYPQRTVFGACVDMEKKEITIYDKHMAVRRFHEWFIKAGVNS